MTEFPKIEHEGFEYYQVGCRKCQCGEHNWSIFSDTNKFLAKCRCGHIIEIPNNKLVSSPDAKKIFELREFI